MNGDGFDDIIVGAYAADPNGTYSGTAYVVFGTAAGFGTELDLSTLDGTNGFAINGASGNDIAGVSVASAGDINGDGFDDVIVGASGNDSGGADSGAAYVIFGKASGFSASIEVSDLDGTDGFKISGESEGDRAAFSVASAGDCDGDGFDDLLVGAYNAEQTFSGSGPQTGSAYIIFGKSTGFDAVQSLSAFEFFGETGFQISGESIYDKAGMSVAAAGDINGDGLDDIIIGAPSAYANGASSGAAYVVFGSANGYDNYGEESLEQLNGTNGFKISGAMGYDGAGFSVSAAGDVNGDGFADIVVGAYGVDANGDYSGAAYVVFGTDSGFSANLDVTALDGTNGFRISGESQGDLAGISVSSAGDINGDGIDDILVGASYADVNGIETGLAYVVYGSTSGFSANLDLSTLDGTNGFQINGEALDDQAGSSVSAAGDVNGDGFDDILVGAGRADANGTDSGAAYIIYGRSSTLDGDDIINGTPAGESLSGGAGNDTIYGGGGIDILDGGTDNDFLDLTGSATGTIFGGSGNDRILTEQTSGTIDGGAGNDTLRLTGNTNLSAVTITGIEVLETAGAGLTATVAQFESFDKITYLNDPASDNQVIRLVVADGGALDISDELGARPVIIQASAAGNTITTGTGNDGLYGGNGNDVLSAGDGNDLIISSLSSDDVLSGGNGDDYLEDAGGNDTLYGGAGSDVLTATGGNDYLDGGEDADRLELLSSLVGTLIGGSGNDSFLTSINKGRIDGGIGLDVLRVAGTGNISALTISSVEVLETVGVTVTATVSQLEAFDTITNMNTPSGDFVLVNLVAADGGILDLADELGPRMVSIRASDLGNTITTGSGNDTLVGGAADDRLMAGGGNDTIRLDNAGVSGDLDEADGGAGTDTVVLKGALADYTFPGTETDLLASYSGLGAGGDARLIDVEFVQFDDQIVEIADLLPGPNSAPVITSNGGRTTAAMPVVENTTFVTTVTATDPDAGSNLSYAIVGGADAADFFISATTGDLVFLTRPNFECRQMRIQTMSTRLLSGSRTGHFLIRRRSR